jgi:hypothetical protein
MALLLDDLLDVSRITRGALNLRKEAVALWRDNPDERRATIKLRMSRQK